MLPIFTAPNTEAKMLAVPRPTKLGECRRGEEARPCPWVGCRHHLLLEVATAKLRATDERRPTSIRLNGPSGNQVTKDGRRPGLASSAAAALVRVWIDEAVELLSRMRYTCTFDVVEDYPDGMESGELALVLGVSQTAIGYETYDAFARWKAGWLALGLTVEDMLDAINV